MTQKLPLVPNLVSFIGLGFAVLSSRFKLFDSLLYQKLGALLFEFRNFVDVIDGVVYRAKIRVEQSNLHDSKNVQEIIYSSNYGSVGKVKFFNLILSNGL